MGFRQRLPWLNERPQFRSPPCGARSAVILEPHFQSSGSVRYIGEALPELIERANPGVLAGSRSSLWRLLGVLRSGVPSHAVVVLTFEGDPILRDAERDTLWAGYGVPVFEQVLTRKGALLAWECEAHNGFHVPGKAEGPNPTCECGSADRLVTVEDVERMLVSEGQGNSQPPPEQRESEPRLIPT